MMQANTGKYISTIFLMIFFPLVMMSQTGHRKYVTRSGDTTIVVMAGHTGLSGENAAFLLDNKVSEDYQEKYNRYKMLKDAAEETNELAGVVKQEKERTNPTSGSLGFRIAKQNIEYLKKEEQAKRLGRERLSKDASVQEMAYMYEKFGERPSYFVNGVEVDSKTASALSDKDILTRSLKTTGTTTGNPNGEVWYVVTSKAFDRLKIGDGDIIDEERDFDQLIKSPSSKNYAERGAYFEEEEYAGIKEEKKEIEKPISKSKVEKAPRQEKYKEYNVYDLLTPAEKERLAAQQREVEELRRQIDAIRKQKGLDPLPAATTAIPETVIKVPIEEPIVEEKIELEVEEKVVPKRNQRVFPVEDEVISFKDSPLEKAKENLDSGITKDTPVKSVRRIKERERRK